MTAIGFGPAFRLNRRGAGAAAFDFTGGALPAGASLTRASAATRWDASGAIASAASDVARFDYDPAGHAPRGLLIEPAATQLLLATTAISTSSPWGTSGSNVSVTAAGQASPDGGNASTITESSATQASVLQQAVTLVSGQNYVGSWHVTKDAVGKATRFCAFRLNHNGSTYCAVIDTATGEIGLQGASPAPNAYGVVDCGAYWRFWMNMTAAASASCNDWFAPAFGATAGSLSGVSPTGSVTGAVTLSCPQVEAVASTSAGPSSYISNGSSIATATRAADVLTLGWGSKGVADGAITARYSFDDGSSQDVAATVSGGVASVPTNLARPWLKRAEKV